MNEEAFAEVAAAQTLEELKLIERKWLGRKGIITLALREHAEREKQARAIEKVMKSITKKCDEREAEIVR